MAQDGDGDSELVDAGQEERVVAAGRRSVAGLEVDDGGADVALELGRQGGDLCMERMQRGVGGERGVGGRDAERGEEKQGGGQGRSPGRG